jgi:3-methyladenine DNA glycosylase AlkC
MTPERITELWSKASVAAFEVHLTEPHVFARLIADEAYRECAKICDDAAASLYGRCPENVWGMVRCSRRIRRARPEAFR